MAYDPTINVQFDGTKKLIHVWLYGGNEKLNKQPRINIYKYLYLVIKKLFKK